ncbi:HIT domain-containing protein [bacterium]|nr:HIT domain-containing protein [bacterium]
MSLRHNPSDYLLEAARTPEQVAEMERLIEAGICLFCDPPERKYVLRSKYWHVVPNKFPYPGTKLHLLIVPEKHVDSLCDLPADAFQDYMLVLMMIKRQYELKAYSHFMRVGDMRFTGASMAHLHGHLIVGDTESEDFESVKVKLASNT